MEIVGIADLYYAASLEQAGKTLGSLPEASRFPIDPDRLREECGKPVGKRVMPSKQALDDEAAAVIRAWAERASAAPERPDRP